MASYLQAAIPMSHKRCTYQQLESIIYINLRQVFALLISEMITN